MFVLISILIEFKVFACSPVLSINNPSCVFSRRSSLSVTRAAWFTSGIWRPTTMSSWFRSPRSRSTPSTLTRMPVTWRQSTAWSVPPQKSVKGAGLSVRCKLTLNKSDSSFSAPWLYQGNCYVWNLAGGIGEEVTQLIPKTKIPAHNRYSLRCKFSPDSTWVPFTLHHRDSHAY